VGDYRDRDQGASGIIECQISFIDYVVRRFAVSLKQFARYAERERQREREREREGDDSTDRLGDDYPENDTERERDPENEKGCCCGPRCSDLACLVTCMVREMDGNREEWRRVDHSDADIVSCLQNPARLASGV
ncbi:hypothetical protein KIPB_012158, partial [Kipferlia bialata]